MYKKILAITMSLVMIMSLSSCSKKAEGPYAGQTLHIYLPGEYTGEFVYEDFEDLTGCRVIEDQFESNEQMYIKVANGDAYDIIIPSDYMIERLRQEDLIQPLDKEKITCLPMLCDQVKNMDFDPDNDYSIPYLWGTVGIVYDKTKVDMEDLEKEGYGIFLDPKYKGNIYLYDSERDMFMVALKHLGYSMNTGDEKELTEAYDFLCEIVNTMEPEIVTDEIIDNMAQGRKALGIIYSGDANYIQTENSDMGFFMPNEGTNVWCDSMVIPKNAENIELAHAYMNFINDYEGAMDTSSTVGYSSPNSDVLKDLAGPGGDYYGIASYIPDTSNKNNEVFHYDENARKIMAELWSKVKIEASNAGKH